MNLCHFQENRWSAVAGRFIHSSMQFNEWMKFITPDSSFIDEFHSALDEIHSNSLMNRMKFIQGRMKFIQGRNELLEMNEFRSRNSSIIQLIE